MAEFLTALGYPAALCIIMLGLGLSLTIGDFLRIFRQPKAAIVALICQMLVLPTICFALVLLFRLPPTLAVGMMILAAAPGGATANLYSHLFRGDIALNISLTAVNSVLAVITVPLITNAAIQYFHPFDEQVGLSMGKVLEVFAIVLIPVAIGMIVRHFRPAFAQRMDRPVRVLSVVVLVLAIIGAVVSNRELFADNIGQLALITATFCVISLTVGYLLPRLIRVERRQAIATSFEVGIHNATLAMVIAQSVLDAPEMVLPAAVYGVLMFFIAFAFGFIIRLRGGGLRRAEGARDEPTTAHR